MNAGDNRSLFVYLILLNCSSDTFHLSLLTAALLVVRNPPDILSHVPILFSSMGLCWHGSFQDEPGPNSECFYETGLCFHRNQLHTETNFL